MKFSDSEIRDKLSGIPGWNYDGTDLVRVVHCPSFREAIAFVQRVAEAAEQSDHHPDIDIRYDAVRLAVHTHSEDGVTVKDFALAEAIQALLP